MRLGHERVDAFSVTNIKRLSKYRDAARLDFGCGGSQFIVEHVAYSYVCP